MKYAFVSGTSHALGCVWVYDTKEEALQRQQSWDEYILTTFPERVPTEYSGGNRLEYYSDKSDTQCLVWSEVIFQSN